MAAAIPDERYDDEDEALDAEFKAEAISGDTKVRACDGVSWLGDDIVVLLLHLWLVQPEGAMSRIVCCVGPIFRMRCRVPLVA